MSDLWQVKGSTIVKSLAVVLYLLVVYAAKGGALFVVCLAIYWYYRNKYKDHRAGPRPGLAPGIESPWLLALYFVAAIAWALLALSARIEGSPLWLVFLVICRHYWIYGRA